MKISHNSKAALLAFLSVAKAAMYEAPVKIKTGHVQGYAALNGSTSSNFTNWKDITVWKGIPYAASTAGNNRWKAPQPPADINGTFLASSFGDECPQASLSLKRKRDTSASYTGSEDCLSVNIWSPATSANESLPVAVWSYGAGTTSSDDMYTGSGVANKGIVFVTYNYRSGPFGWLALPELSAENPRNISGNYGLFDQIEVLKWIKENIASFGGDPDHITTVGQSFGTGAVLHTINSPLAKGLIVGAIAESGIKDPYDPEYLSYGSVHVNYTFLYPFSETYAKSLNASTVADLRSLSTGALLEGTGVSTFGEGFDPVEDGYAIPWSYQTSLDVGPANDVPVLVGNNKDEDGVTKHANYTLAEYKETLDEYYNATWADVFFDLYPANDTVTASAAYKAQLRDAARVSTWLWANGWATSASSPVFTYEWNHAPPGQDQGAYHASEIYYVLNSLYAVSTTDWEQDDYEIAEMVSSYWANFIKTGDPNTGDSYKKGNLTYWPKSVSTRNTTFNIGDDYEEVPLANATQIEAITAWFHNATTAPE